MSIRSKIVLFSILSAFPFLACSEQTPAVETGNDGVATEQGVQLEIVATIGVELGDSNYVLGAVQQIDHDLDGNILVLDRSACCVRVYSPNGEFINQISNEGSGPGEIRNPMSMTVVGDGRVFVETPFSGGMHAFTVEGEWLGIVTPFHNNPPMNTIGADSNAYIAIRLEIIPDENDGLIVSTFVGRYEETEDPVIKYWEYEFPFDPNNLTALLQNTIMGRTFTADRDGNVFIAELTSEEYLVQGFRSSGELFVEIEQDVNRVEKTALEIEDEEIYVIAYLESLGANGVVLEYDADPYRNTIKELEVDGEERIWVRRGNVLEPIFDVFDYSGEFLFTATVPDAIGEDLAFWDFNIDEMGMSAYSINPELFQQVYVLEIAE